MVKIRAKNFSFKQNLNPEVFELIKKMLEADENRRISSFEILNTPIIRRNVAEFSKELLSEQKQLLIENYLRRIGRDNQRELPANVVRNKQN